MDVAKSADITTSRIFSFYLPNVSRLFDCDFLIKHQKNVFVNNLESMITESEIIFSKIYD